MSRTNPFTRRIFGGKEPEPTFAQVGSAAYARPLYNPTDQATAETLSVATHRRKFQGPMSGHSTWSYHINVVSGAGATSALKFYYSWLPDPDPTTSAHWVDSGITAIDLSTPGVSFGTKIDASPLWIMAEAVVATSTGTLWGYVRSSGTETFE